MDEVSSLSRMWKVLECVRRQQMEQEEESLAVAIVTDKAIEYFLFFFLQVTRTFTETRRSVPADVVGGGRSVEAGKRFL